MLPILKKIFPKQIKEICCVSTGRTGTNFLFGKLKGCQELLVNGEILHPIQSYVNWEVRDLVQDKKAISQEDLDEMARMDKARLLNLLREARDDLGRSCMISKIFPIQGHLNMTELEKLIIRRRGVGVVVIIRNPLRVFLSLCKARHVGAFGKVETTRIVVELPPKDLISFIQRSTQINKKAIKLCEKHGTPYVVVSYEKMFEGLNDQSPVEIMLESLNTFMDPPLQLSKDLVSEHEKQDRSGLADGIANFDEVSAALGKEDYSALLNNSTEYQSVLGIHETSK